MIRHGLHDRRRRSGRCWLSIAVGLAAACAAIWFAAKVFRIGLLMHGKPPNFATLVRWVRQSGQAAGPSLSARLSDTVAMNVWVGPPATTTRSGRGASIQRRCRRRRCCRTTPSASRPSRSTTRSTARRTRRFSTGWSAATPDRFKLTLKAPKRITHDARLRDCGDRVRQFLETAAVLGPKLGALLFQLPPNLKKDLALFDAFLETFPPRVCAAFEFRHAVVVRRRGVRAAARRGTWRCASPTARSSPRRSRSRRRLRRTSGCATRATRRRTSSAGPEVVSGLASRCEDVFVYFKHEEAGKGPGVREGA